MKPIMLKLIIFTGLLIGLNGCYTIIWSPDMDFPTENTSATEYYGDDYYGSYYYYYDYPWWLDIVPPSTGAAAGSRDENKNIETIRNMNGRGTPTGIPELQPPSRNATTTNPENKGSSNNSGSSSTETTVRSSSTSNSGSTSGRQNSSGSGNSTRNNNGGRNSGGGR